MKLDLPVRQVLPDLAILGIAQRQPKNDAELLQARGVDGVVQRGAVASEILAAVNMVYRVRHRRCRPVAMTSSVISDLR